MHEFNVLAVFFTISAVYVGVFLVWEKLAMKDPLDTEQKH